MAYGDTQMISPQVMMKRSSLHMRHEMESCDQGGEDQGKALHRWTGCKCEGQVGGFEATNHMWRGSLSKDLAPMDQGNGEEQVQLRLMNQ